MNVALMTAGWIGGFLCLTAYGLLIAERVSASGTWFTRLNILGSGLLFGSAISAGALPNAMINMVWIGLAVYGHLRRGQPATSTLIPDQGTGQSASAGCSNAAHADLAFPPETQPPH